MFRTKNLATVLLMFILTAGVVLLPMLINAQNAHNRIDDKEYWTYSGQKHGKITQKSIAELYYTEELSSSIIISRNEQYDPGRVRNCVSSIIDTLFFEESDLTSHIKAVTDGTIAHFYSESLLTILDNEPLVLTAVAISFSNGDETVDLVYEEKTQTVISFSYCNSQWYSSESEMDEFKQFQKESEHFAELYYIDALGLSSNMYYSNGIYSPEILFGLTSKSAYENDYVKEEFVA